MIDDNGLDTLIETDSQITEKDLLLARTRLATVVFLLFLAMPSLVTFTARAAPMNVAVSADGLTIDYRLEFRTNLTRTMPLVAVFIDHSNSSSLVDAIAAPFDKAIRKLVPGASLDTSALKFAAITRVLDSTTGLWSLQENITLSVLGARSNPGELVSYNTALLSMNISDPIRLANVELNQIGETYLLQPLLSMTASQTPPDAYFFNSVTYTGPFVPEILTRRFNLLDFSWISPIARWSTDSENPASEAIWRFDPSTMRVGGAPFNLTIASHPVENTFLNFIVEQYTPTVELTAPPRAKVDGSTISFQLSSPLESLMPVIVSTILGVGLIAYFAERRVTRIKTGRTRGRR